MYSLPEDPPLASPMRESGIPTKSSCIEKLSNFLDTCDSQDKVTWTSVELDMHFPITKWTKQKE